MAEHPLLQEVSIQVESNALHHRFTDVTMLCCHPDAQNIVSRHEGSIGGTLKLHLRYLE